MAPLQSTYSLNTVLVPRRFREAWPFICMYHRSDNHIKTSMEKGVPSV